MGELFSWLIPITLLGWLIGHAIIATRRDRYVQTLRAIHIHQGKYGPFRNSPLKGFSRLRREKLIIAATRARARAAQLEREYNLNNAAPAALTSEELNAAIFAPRR